MKGHGPVDIDLSQLFNSVGNDDTYFCSVTKTSVAGVGEIHALFKRRDNSDTGCRIKEGTNENEIIITIIIKNKKTCVRKTGTTAPVLEGRKIITTTKNEYTVCVCGCSRNNGENAVTASFDTRILSFLPTDFPQIFFFFVIIIFDCFRYLCSSGKRLTKISDRNRINLLS